ncbi:MAG: T9SS type A sorting domain-containing protein [Flavobacteriales bacterium]|nr:T9SS type A sorting domain-containing protein [Flavobacteriales bacterium]
MNSLIIPQPEHPELYYVFMVDRHDFARAGYVVVDMSQNGGLGEVISDTITYYMDSASCKIAATLTTEGNAYWIMHHEMGSNEFAAFRLSATGLDTVPVLSHTGTPFLSGFGITWYDQYGPMTYSMDGSLLALAAFDDNYDTTSTNELFHFNNSNGVVQYITSFPRLMSPSGVEFSPDNSQLYWYAVNDTLGQYYYELWQYSLSSLLPTDIHASAFLVYSDTPNNMSYQGEQLLLAPNGNIYILHGAEYLAVVDDPDQQGALCAYQDSGLALPSTWIVHWLPIFCKRYHDSEPFWTGIPPPSGTINQILGPAYPVPADEQVTLPLNGLINDALLRVYNAGGTLVQEQRIPPAAVQAIIDTKVFANGVYSYQLMDDSGVSAAHALIVVH